MAIDDVVLDEKGNNNKKVKRAPKIQNVKDSKQKSNTRLGLGAINLDVIEEVKKNEQLSIYLNKNLADKIKTISYNKKISMSKLVELVLEEAFQDVVADNEAVELYAETHKGKGRKNSNFR